jgi:hypothetical protein
MSHVKIMEKMEKMEKFLRQFPKGITAGEFAEKFGKHVRGKPYGRQTGYDYLNSLVLQGKAEKKGNLFYPKSESETKLHEKVLSKEERELLEQKAEAYSDAEWLAKQWKALEPLDELYKIERRIRKEMELEP